MTLNRTRCLHICIRQSVLHLESFTFRRSFFSHTDILVVTSVARTFATHIMLQSPGAPTNNFINCQEPFHLFPENETNLTDHLACGLQ